MAGTPVLQFRNVDTHYGPVHVLKNVNIEIHTGRSSVSSEATPRERRQR